VIMPAYNAERTIGVALESVLSQSFEDFELIIIDDGSSDATKDVVRASSDSRIRCVSTQNGGVSRARNRGLSLASGELVAFLDADDVWYRTKLKRQVETMAARPSVGLCFTSAELVDDQLRKIGEDCARRHEDFCEALLLIGNVLPASGSSVMARRSLVTAAGGFDTGLSQCADWDLWLRLSLKADFEPIAEPLVQYRKSAGTMSSDPALLERDTFALLDKFFATAACTRYRAMRRRVYSNQWLICSGTYLHAGRFQDSLRCLRRGLAADPGNLRRPLLFPARTVGRAWDRRSALSAMWSRRSRR
jgi:glycosyltransferase involved in cell wall biosynthesis